MGRTVSIDYGAKRCGLAISDSLGMIANGLPTVETNLLMTRLKELKADPGFSRLVVGLPVRNSGEPSAIEEEIQHLLPRLEKEFPSVEVDRFDERFTSKIALQTMIAAGSTRKQRRDKGTIDKVSATLILQEYLNSK